MYGFIRINVFVCVWSSLKAFIWIYHIRRQEIVKIYQCVNTQCLSIILGRIQVSLIFRCKAMFLFTCLYVRESHGKVTNVQDCDILSEFKLQSHYYIHFQTKSLRERYHIFPSYQPPAMLFFYKYGFGIK